MGTSENPASRSGGRIGTLAHHLRRAAIVAFAALALAACGGSDDDAAAPQSSPPPSSPQPPPQPPQPPAASIAIDQTGLLLPGRGQVATLTATLAAADGTRVTGDISWTSSRPDAVAVDAGGRLSALTDSGSAQIVARSGSLVSRPLVVIVANAAAGALLLADAQIVGDPVEADPAAPPSRNNFYRVTLAPEVALPTVGSLLGGTGSKPLSGRVVAVEAASRTVTLEPVHPRALLPDLNVNEVIDLAQAEATINPEVAARFDVRRDGGRFELTPRPGTSTSSRLARRQAATGTRALPPFTTCESAITGLGNEASLPVALSLPAPFSVTVPTTLEYVDTPANGVEKLVVSGTPTVKLETTVTVTAAFEGKVECKVEIGTLTVPIGGILSWVAGGQIPYGIGVEFGGKLTLATASVGGKVEASTVVRLGFERPAGGATSFVATMADWTTTHSWTHDWPTVGDFRIEPYLAGYAFAEFELGSRIFTSLRVEAFKAKLGPKLAGSFAPKLTQIADTSYKSGYKLSVEGSASMGRDLEGILKTLGVSSVNALELSASLDLSTSPTGTLVADRASFTVGDRVGFRATLDNVEYLAGFGGYVVDEVLLVRQSGGTSSVVGRIEAADGQRTFDFTYDATGPGSASEFYVFVVVDLLPLDLLSLELAQATAPTDPGGGTGPVTVLPPAGDDIYGYDINAAGYVVGSLQGTVSGIRAFIWRGGSPTILSKFQPDDAAASARGINDRDDVVGVIAGVSGSVAVMWPGGGSPVDLNARVAGTGWTLQDAIDINNKGQIVGIGTKDGVSAIFFLDSDGSVSKVIDRGSSASVFEVAEDGAVVGSYDFQSGIGTRGYLWRKGEDLIVIEGQARGLSGAGAVVGSVRASLAPNRGARWHPPFGQSDFTEIKPNDPAHLTWPQDISAGGSVVGMFSGTAPDGNAFSKAFHSRAGVFTDLTALHGGDAIQQEAARINETGRILVRSFRRDSTGAAQQYFQVVPSP